MVWGAVFPLDVEHRVQTNLLTHIGHTTHSCFVMLLLLNWVRATPDRPFTSSKSSSQTRLIGHALTRMPCRLDTRTCVSVPLPQAEFCVAKGYKADCEVIYGDTDSVMVNFKVRGEGSSSLREGCPVRLYHVLNAWGGGGGTSACA